jgi:hypothetical protein
MKRHADSTTDSTGAGRDYHSRRIIRMGRYHCGYGPSRPLCAVHRVLSQGKDDSLEARCTARDKFEDEDESSQSALAPSP